MTVPVETEDDSGQESAREGTVAENPGRSLPTLRGARDTIGICPYLTAAGGSWRMATPSRDHRCAAVDPPGSQPTDKQRRHCLVSEHVECTMFRAARDARSTTLAAGADPALVAAADARRRTIARTAPVLLEPPRLVDRAVRLQFERGPGQIALIALMILAFAIVALTRLSASNGAGPAPSVTPSPSIASESPTPHPTPVPSPSPSASGAPSASAGPSARATYKVKKGDSLLSIAKAFGTTVAKIRAFNGLTSASLKVGQVLRIP